MPHHPQTEDHTCGPAAVRMVLDALWGIRVEEASLAERMGTDPEIGTRQKMMARFVASLGLEAIVRHTDTGINEIGDLMDRGYVVVVCFWLAGEDTDHYAVVSRLDPKAITLEDPWQGPGTVMALGDFDRHWFGDPRVPTRRDRWLLAVRVPGPG